MSEMSVSQKSGAHRPGISVWPAPRGVTIFIHRGAAKAPVRCFARRCAVIIYPDDAVALAEIYGTDGKMSDRTYRRFLGAKNLVR